MVAGAVIIAHRPDNPIGVAAAPHPEEGPAGTALTALLAGVDAGLVLLGGQLFGGVA